MNFLKSKTWLISVLLLLATSAYLFYYLYENERERKIDEILGHQRIHAKQAARSFHELFQKWDGVLFYLSQNNHVIEMDDRAKLEFDVLLEMFKDEVKSVTRVDSAGIIIYTAPYYPHSVGVDISNQAHMKKILMDHGSVVSDVFTSVQGYKGIAIHYPVFKNEKFNGTVAFVLDFKKIAKMILDEIKIGKSGYAWMLSSDGTELYCPVPGHLGKSIFETSRGFDELKAIATKMIAGREGLGSYFYNREGSSQKNVKKTVYYTPVKIKNTLWSVAVVYSEDEITASLVDFRNKLMLIISLLFFGGVLISYFTIKAWIILRESEAKKVAEKNLWESEERFKQVIERLPQLVWTATAEGKCDFLNNRWKEYTGISNFENYESLWLNQVHPEDKSVFLKAWNKAVEEGTEFNLEFRLLGYDGFYHWFDSRALPLKNMEGQIVKWFGSNTDIQKERDMVEALRENEERYRLISMAASDYMFSSKIDENGKSHHNWVAGAFESITGYSFEEYVARGGWLASIHPEDKEQDQIDMEKLHNNIPVTSEVRTITKSGKTVWVRVYAYPVWDEKNNKLKGINGAVRDITERKNAEEELKKLYAATEQSPASIVITDLHGHIEYVNSMFTKTSGYTPDEVRGKLLRILKSSDESEKIWQVLNSGLEWRGEYYNRKKDGTNFWESVLITPIKDDRGKTSHYLVVQEDITEKKKNIEELILAKEKAEEAIRVKNVFLANMSHELRTPLIGILGYSEMLANELKNSEYLEMAMGIRRSGNRLLNTLNLILDLTRIESDRIEINLRRVNLADELTYAYHTFRGAALEKKINFTMEINPEVLPGIVDERLFRIILDNLINNAIKFTSRGGITIKAGIDKGFVFVKVSDTGIGISEEYHAVIFEEFRQVSEGINRDYQGTGLGLFITKKYVEILGGSISVESKVGVGSAFTVYFPLKTNF